MPSNQMKQYSTPLKSAAWDLHFKTFLPVALLLSILLAYGPGAQAAPRDRDTIRHAIYFSELEATGQYDALARQWLQSITSDPNSAESLLMLNRLDEIADYCNDYYALIREYLAEFPLNDISNGHTQILIRQLQHDLLSRNGQWNRARELMLQDGTLRNWMLCGPFGTEQQADYTLDHAYPPEQEIDFKATYPRRDNRRHPARWVQYMQDVTQSWASPSDVFSESGCVYAYCQIKSNEEKDAVLQILCPPSYKVWLNGHAIHSSDAREGDQPVEQWLRVQLGIGWNSLLVKLPTPNVFHLRLLDSHGRPLGGIAQEREIMRWNIKTQKGDTATVVTPWPLSQFLDEVKQHPDSAFLHIALSTLYQYDNDDLCLRHAETALQLTDNSPAAQMNILQALDVVSHLPQATVLTRRKAAMDKAIEKNPTYVPALFRLADYYEENDQAKKVFNALNSAEAVNPDLGYVYYRMAEHAFSKQWLHETRVNLQKAESKSPNNTTIHRFWANYYSTLQNHQKELEIFYQIREWDRSANVEVRIANILTTMGKYEEAIGQYESLLEIHPEHNQYKRQLADLYRRHGNVKKATRIYRRLLHQNPSDQSLAKTIADLEYRHGSDAKGTLALYESLLDSNPGRDGIRRFLQYKNNQSDDFSLPFQHDTQALIDAAPDASGYPDASALCLLNQRVIQFYEDYSYSIIDHKLYKVLTQGGQDLLGRIGANGELMEARTITAEGKSLEPLLVEGSRMVMPGLNIDACIETKFRNHQGAPSRHEFEAPVFYFQDPSFQLPMVLSDYIVILPKSLSLDILINNTDIQPVRTELNDTVVWRYQMRNLTKLVPEPLMPTPDKTLPNVKMKRPTDWAYLQQLYGPYSYSWEYPTQLIEETAAKAVQGKQGILEKAEALYLFVNREITNEQGENVAHATLVGKSGVRDYLFAAMAKTIGMEIVTGFARPNSAFVDAIDDSYRSRRDYGTPITGVKLENGEYLWLTFQSRYQPFRSLHPMFNGGTVLLPSYNTGSQPAILPLPTVNPDINSTKNSIALTLQADGSAAGLFTMEIPGVDGAQLKENIIKATQDQRVQFIASRLNNTIRGASSTGGGFVDLEEFGTPLLANLNFKVRNLTSGKRDQTVEIPLCMDALSLQNITNKKYRRFDMDIRFQYRAINTTTIQLEDGLQVETLPKPIHMQIGGLEYALKFTRQENQILIERHFHLDPCLIDNKDYDKLVKFASKADAADQMKLVVTLPATPEDIPIDDTKTPDEPTDDNGEK